MPRFFLGPGHNYHCSATRDSFHLKHDGRLLVLFAALPDFQSKFLIRSECLPLFKRSGKGLEVGATFDGRRPRYLSEEDARDFWPSWHAPSRAVRSKTRGSQGLTVVGVGVVYRKCVRECECVSVWLSSPSLESRPIYPWIYLILCSQVHHTVQGSRGPPRR